MLESVDYKKHGKHQKILIGEQVPAIGWYLADVIFKTALIDVAVLHSGLVQKERSALVEESNNPTISSEHWSYCTMSHRTVSTYTQPATEPSSTQSPEALAILFSSEVVLIG